MEHRQAIGPQAKFGLLNTLAQDSYEVAFGNGTPKMVEACCAISAQAVLAAFATGRSSLKLERFEVLRDAICEVTTGVIT
eukprot:7150162-Prymnesium_polylepis.1